MALGPALSVHLTQTVPQLLACICPAALTSALPRETLRVATPIVLAEFFHSEKILSWNHRQQKQWQGL